MSGIVPLSALGEHRRPRRSNCQRAPNRRARAGGKRIEHHAGRFADGDDVDSRRTLQRRDNVGIVEGPLHEPPRIDAVNGGAQDRREVLSELGSGKCQLIDLSGIGPGGKPGEHIELAEKAADDLICVSLATQPIELCHHFDQRLLDVADRAFRIELALLLEALLALQEFFAIEIGNGYGMEHRFAMRTRIGQEA
jgi:hypothetical protein